MANLNRTVSKTFESNFGTVIRVVTTDREIYIYKKDPATLPAIAKISDRESNINYGYKIFFDENDNLLIDTLIADVSKDPIELKTVIQGHFYVFNAINKIGSDVEMYVLGQLKKLSKKIHPQENVDGSLDDDFYLSLSRMGSPFLRSLPQEICIENCKNFFSVKNRGLEYKQIIHKYFGVSTEKMLRSVWEILIEKSNAHNKDKINESVLRLIGAFCKNAGVDYTYQLMEKLKSITDGELYCQHYVNDRTISPIFKSVGPKKLVNLLTKDLYETSTFLADIAGMLNQYDTQDKIPEPLRHEYPDGLVIKDNFSSLREFHDKVVVKYNLLKIEENKRPIDYDPIYLKLNDEKDNQFSLFVPQNTSDLIRWGVELNICIGSYCKKAVDGDTLLLGVLKNDKIAYCLEFVVDNNRSGWVEGTSISLEENGQLPLPVFKTIVNSWNSLEGAWSYIYPAETFLMPEIVQFKGLRNSAPTEEDKNSILELIKKWSISNKNHFIEAGISVSDGYVGV
jgi:hypothetical protein